LFRADDSALLGESVNLELRSEFLQTIAAAG